MKILGTLLGNDIGNIIINMLPTEKDKFYEIYNNNKKRYADLELISQYKCGCFCLRVADLQSSGYYFWNKEFMM